MELNKCLKERRSVRKFLDKPVSWERVVKILDAGRYAPSSGNIQNWVFIVIKKEEQKKKLADACEQGFIRKASYLIAVCSKQDRIKRLYGERGEKLYSIQNCAAAIQNMLLEAYSLGVGSCWIGAFNSSKVGRILDLKENIIPQAIIALGYNNDKHEIKRNDLENFVFFEKYENTDRI